MKIRYSSLTELEYPTAFHEVSKAIIRSSVSAVFFNRSEPLSFSIARTLMCTFHQYVVVSSVPKIAAAGPTNFPVRLDKHCSPDVNVCLYFFKLFVAMLSKSC